MTRDLAHWDVIEALEEVCVYKVFEVYGVTDHHDKHRLKVQAIVGEVDKMNCQVFKKIYLTRKNYALVNFDDHFHFSGPWS